MVMSTSGTDSSLSQLGAALSLTHCRIGEHIEAGHADCAPAQREIDTAVAQITRIASAASFAGLRSLRSAAPPAIAVLGAAFGSAAHGQPLNPLEFPSLGVLNTGSHPGYHTIDTD